MRAKANVAGVSMAASSQVTAKRLRLNGNLIDLIGGMAGALVDALHGLGAGRLREAEHHARFRVRPGVLEVDVLLALDGEIGLMCLHEPLRGDVDHPPVDIHELRHRAPPMLSHREPSKHIRQGLV
jgi:hypothetical protein